MCTATQRLTVNTPHIQVGDSEVQPVSVLRNSGAQLDDTLYIYIFIHGRPLLLLSCVNCRISRLVDASQIRVSSSRSVKPLSPFGGLCIVQSSMMCCTDWFGAPHSHSEVDFRPHLFRASPNLPTPVRIRL